ncbi:hypothetical protein GHT06_022687 [Daphnia sinensis]|uniref:Uncharacterized protein n=1 Tax=Daphnia sinensis TaxID=1820382 RepID=A0AAD5KIQ1_9CRUS|nr:hypothetical protein GHT06_022687 [Daphnia sinensis]
MLMWNGISAIAQFIVVLFWLATIFNGKSSSSSIVGNDTKQYLFHRPFQEESKIPRYAKWKFHWPRKLVLPTDETVIIERSATKDDDVSSLIGNSSATSSDEMPKIKEDAVKQNEFSSSTNLIGGGGLQLFGITDSFVNPGTLISSSIESGLQKLSELAGSFGNKTSPPVTGGSPAQFFGIANSAAGNPGKLPELSQDFSSKPYSNIPAVQNGTVAQFFGIANIYVGDMNGATSQATSQAKPSLADCPICPAPSVGCPAPAAHDIVTLSVEACESVVSLESCSASSVTPTGTLFVLYPVASSSPRKFVTKYFRRKKKKKRIPGAKVSTATIRIVGLTPETKITVTCPNIPPGITVTTQSGTILPYKSRENTGYVQLEVSGSASQTDVAVACVWKSDT